MLKPKHWILVILLAVAFLLYPLAMPSYFVTLLTQVFMLSIFTMALNLMVGYTGMASLGHGAFFGAGAYASILVLKYVSQNVFLGLAAGILTAAALAAVFALLSIRRPGIYFLFITLALGQLVWAVVFGWRSFTGGDDGMPAPARPEVWPGLQVSGGVFYFYAALVCFAAVLVLIHTIIRSPFGHALIGIRENEDRMGHMGFNVWRHKFLVFLISGGLSGFAGVLWAYYNGFVSPYNASFELSAEALLIVILGGSGTLIGPAMGTAVVVLIKNIVAAYTERWLLVLGLAYILTILYARGGILGTIGTWLRRAGTSR